MARGFETADPLRRRVPRRRPVRSPQTQVATSRLATAPANDLPLQALGDGKIATTSQLNRLSNSSTYVSSIPSSSMQNIAGAGTSNGPDSGIKTEDFSGTEDSDAGLYREYTLRACSPEDLDNLRYHIVRFHSRSRINPAEQFTPPIRFGRKDPKGLQSLVGDDAPSGSAPGASDNAGDGSSSSAPGEDVAEKVRKPNPFFRRKKTHQVQSGGGEEGEAARKLRYEEHFPWVLEDFDSKNIWVSNYEAAQSNTYVVFVFDRDGFKMIPLEKWYKMTPRNKFATLSLDQAEERMTKRGTNASRWVMDRLQAQQSGGAGGPNGPGSLAGLSESLAAGTSRIYQRPRLRTVEGSEERGSRDNEEADYEEDFADDEEAPIMEGPEEDVKEVEERIKREQRQIGGIAEDPSEIDALFDDDGKDSIDKNGRKLRRYLRSLEKNAYYDSDDDENPYASEEESDLEPELKIEGDLNQVLGNGDVPGNVPAPLVMPFRRKVIKPPAPGFAILQLPQAVLSKFPIGEWNPNVPNRALEAPDAAVKLEEGHSTAPSNTDVASAEAGPAKLSSAAAAATSLYSADRAEDPLLLTSEDVVSAIPAEGLTINELISVLKQKLKKHADNKNRLRAILKEVVQFKDGKLMPR